MEDAKRILAAYGYTVAGSEPLKLTIGTKAIGWRGDELADFLRENSMEAEFADPDFVVMMFTPENAAGIESVVRVLCAVEKRPLLTEAPPVLSRPVPCLSPREAVMSVQERIPVEEAAGRVLASASVNCPPAVPIVVCGERIDETAVQCFRYYGIEQIYAVQRKENAHE